MTRDEAEKLLDEFYQAVTGYCCGGYNRDRIKETGEQIITALTTDNEKFIHQKNVDDMQEEWRERRNTEKIEACMKEVDGIVFAYVRPTKEAHIRLREVLTKHFGGKP